MTKTILVLILIIGNIALAHADCSPITLSDGTLVPVSDGATRVRLHIDASNALIPFQNDTVSNKSWKATAAGINSIKSAYAGLTADMRSGVSLQPVDSNGKAVGATIPFIIGNESAANVCPAANTADDKPDGSQDTTTVSPATPIDCAAVNAINPLPPGISRGRYVKPILFNSAGAICRAPTVLRYGDYLVVGVLVKQDEALPPPMTATFDNCGTETPEPVIYSSGKLSDVNPTDIKNQAGKITKQKTTQTYWLASQSCAADSPTVTLRFGSGDKTTTTTYTLHEYKRYTASLNLGAVYTSRRDPHFALHTVDSKSVIADESADGKGIEYVGAVVVHGIFNYWDELFSHSNGTDPGQWPYKGRDLLHETTWKDSLGFVMTAGLKDPGSRFGVGFSYEIARGLDVIAVYEFFKTKRLDGVAVGGEFTGTVDQLPQKDVWRKGVSVGLTFDIAYATQLFTGGAK